MPLDQPGIEIRPIKQPQRRRGIQRSVSTARALARDLVGAPGDGWRIAMTLLGFERGMSTLGQQMQFVRELEWVIDAARESGADHDPVLRQRIGRAAGLRVMRYNALRMLSGSDDTDAGAGTPRREALIYKYFWSNWHRDWASSRWMPSAACERDRPCRRKTHPSAARIPVLPRGHDLRRHQRNPAQHHGRARLGMPREARGTA